MSRPIKTLSKSGYRKPVPGNKDERTVTASEWIKTLDSKWKDQVQNAIENTFVRTGVNPMVFEEPVKRFDNTITRVFKNDVVTCAKAAVTHSTKGSKICVLNYASYFNPGGGFLKGATAQEEALCFATGLYPCLKSKQDWYDEHKLHDTDSCYSHDYIYSKDVPFIVNGKCYLVDVLTMAAPNSKSSKFSPVEDIFEERMRCAFLAGLEQGCDIILLGAWGCGVFGNDPKFVANCWYNLTKEFDGCYKEVVHPVLDAQMYKVFKDVFK